MAKKKDTKDPVSTPGSSASRNVFSLLPPTNEPGKFTLIVLRPTGNTGPFGAPGASASAIFSVDGMFPVNDGRNPATHFRGFRYVGENRTMDTVVEFPISASFLLVQKTQVQFLSQEESLRESIAQEKSLRAVEEELMGSEKKEISETTIDPKAVGQYL